MIRAQIRQHSWAVTLALLCVASSGASAQGAPTTSRSELPDITLNDFGKLDKASQTKRLDVTLMKVMNAMIDRLNSPVDAKGQSKSAARIESDRTRAILVAKIVRNYDPTEVGVRMRLVTKEDPNVFLESVLARYITDEVRKLEAKQRQ